MKVRWLGPTVTFSALLVAGCGAKETQTSEVQTSEETPEADNLAQPAQAAANNFAEIYGQGVPFDAFLASANRRRETWHDNYERARVPDALLQRARAIPGHWRVLVMAEDWCGDSANTIPYLARLLEQLDNVDMRVVNSEVGAPVGEAHLTPDGRSATPTVVVLDDEGRDVGCWVERPAALQEWFLTESEKDVDIETVHDRGNAWYEWDVGESTMSEVTDVLAGAASGSWVCH